MNDDNTGMAGATFVGMGLLIVAAAIFLLTRVLHFRFVMGVND